MIYLYKKARTRQRRLKEEAEQKQQTTEPLDIPGQQKEQTAALEVPELKAEQIETGNEPTVTSTKSEPKIEPKTKKTKPVETEEEKIEKKRRRAYRWKLMISLLPPAFLAAVDTTIVATATTTIASDFNELNQFNWIVTAYTLTSTAFIPAYGQIANIYGRHFALQCSMFFMVVGSTLCAAAQNWTMLLFGRAIQGLSAAGIMNMIKIILADKVSLAEQSKNTTIFSFLQGISYAVGPLIGGTLAQSNWRYCFVISIPIAVLSHVLIFFLLRKELIQGTHALSGPTKRPIWSGLETIDVGGIILFIFGTGLIILGTSWGGSTYPWTSASVLAPIIIGSILFVSFFAYEYLLEPGKLISRLFPKHVAMIPWKLFSRKDVALLCVINAATGAALYSAFYFVGLFWTLPMGYSPQKAGYQLLYYTPGLGVGVYAAMFFCNVWPGQTFYPLWLGSILEATGFAVLAWATSTRDATLVSVMMAIAGGGTGLRFMPGTLHAAGVWPTQIASVMSLMDFALPFGGTLSIAIMSAVFYNKFSQSVKSLQLSDTIGGVSRNSTQSISAIDALPNNVRDVLRQQAARAVMWAFISALPLMGLSVAAATVLGNVWIKPKKKEGDAARGEVIYSSYLLAAFTGSLKRRKVPVDAREPQQDAEKNVIPEKTNEP